MTHAWFDLYAATLFEVRPPGAPPLVLRHGAHCPALDALLAHAHPGANSWAFLTAWNPRSRPLAPLPNSLRQLALVGEVQARGLPFYPAEGRAPAGAPPWSEESLLVVGLALPQAVALGRRYEQNAILAGQSGEAARLVACLEGVFDAPE